MKDLIVIKGKRKVDYSRKHDLTADEIRASPVFIGLNDSEIENVRATFIQMCHILIETFENQDIELELKTNKHHIATGQLIELESFNRKAA